MHCLSKKDKKTLAEKLFLPIDYKPEIVPVDKREFKKTLDRISAVHFMIGFAVGMIITIIIRG